MSAHLIGYEFLRNALRLPAFRQPPFARVEAVTRVSTIGDDILAVPPGVAPDGDDPLDHLLFALKHEPINLQTAVPALQRIPAEAVVAAFEARPAGRYVRLAGWLWELSNQRALPTAVVATGPYVPLFDPATHLTGSSRRDTRWRVDFNGIGTPRFCATVRRTPAIEALLAQDILSQVQAFVASIDPDVLDRAVRWAYLSETESSYDIEREKPTLGKREAFASLLARARESEPLTEAYLVGLQNLAVTNPYDRAAAFRTGQNWLRNNLRVTYLPPPPGLGSELMAELMRWADEPDAAVDPLVRAAVTSFAFVFVHPFMDGNGRLSRFLFHKIACQDPRMANGLVLPVSIAMKRHERDYLSALESFSKPAQQFWDATIVDARVFADFRGAPEMYRYWDASACVEFGLRMAKEALDKDLRDESAYLHRFDRAWRAVDDALDMNRDDLLLLVQSALQNSGRLSSHRRKQLIGKGHPPVIVDRAAGIVAEVHAAELAKG